MPESGRIPTGSTMVETLGRALRRHVMQAWFPRCLDHEKGGYLCDFDRQWRPVGPQVRMLEFQARQTRVAARLALAFPAEGEWAEYARHGFRYLRDVMWDEEGGGSWLWLMDREGRPEAGATKHAHSGA
jgi:cellobiose epimerase